MKFPEPQRVIFPHTHIYYSKHGDPRGVFHLHFHGNKLLCIATDGRECKPDEPVWEHVSITVRDRKSRPLTRPPAWDEMCVVKNAFWDEHEVVIQIHPAKADYVNNHPYCLHLWRPVNERIPTPPYYFVGPKTDKEALLS
jgi:hypothetical protein